MTILPKKKPSTASGNQGSSNGGASDDSDKNEVKPDNGASESSGANSGASEQSGASSGASAVNTGSAAKRRHRASPLRSVRSKRGAEGERGVGAAREGAESPAGAANQGAPGNRELASGQSEQSGAIDEQSGGYNSEDEYYGTPSQLTEEEWAERERQFERKLRKKGMMIKKMGEDGACLFRAVADQVYGDQDMHSVVRRHCMDYMAKNADYFSQWITEDIQCYIQRKRRDNCHGNHVEVQALSEMYNRSIEVYHYTAEPINIFQSSIKTENEPIRVSYHKNSHYNSIVDPYKATIGVGLGLPEFVPGLADKNLVCDAIRQSEEFEIEQAMLEDKLKATDWEATNEAIEEQVARESYLQWLRDNERRSRKQTRTATATCSSSAGAGLSPDIRSPDTRSSGGRSPRNPTLRSLAGSAYSSPSHEEQDGTGHGSAAIGMGFPQPPSHTISSASSPRYEPMATNVGGTEYSLLPGASFINQLPPDLFGLNEWEDAEVLARVLAASQQEYLESLKWTYTKNSDSPPSDGTTGPDLPPNPPEITPNTDLTLNS